jgi:hypothetical protein
VGVDFVSFVVEDSASIYNFRPISIIEGLATIVAGALSFWIIQDFPDTAKFLNETERTFVIRRLQTDDQFSAGGEKLRWKYITQSLLDWKTWIGSTLVKLTCLSETKPSSVLIYAGCDMPLYAFSLFLPTIINQVIHFSFGYNLCINNIFS